MSDELVPGRSGNLRTGYLKMKSVLVDRVTGLPALPLLFDRLRTLLEKRRAIGVLHVDIAELELVESLYGWQVFDDVVARVAGSLRQSLGEELPRGALIALNGVAGDRFVVFVPARADGGQPDGPFLAETGRALCRRLERLFDEDAFAGLSPGLCFRSGHALLAENPFQRFERCVYAAVHEARGADARREWRRERSWGEELRGIIRQRAISTVFQPVVELDSRAIFGHEALARGPRDSLFESPRAMFALSDRVGLAGELDRLCLAAACAAAGAVVPLGKLFLNIRSECLERNDQAGASLGATLERHGLEPGQLVLEVSERAAGVEVDPFVESVQGLKSQGFGVALDDVGTGRVGLAAIERARPDFLKLDRCLVRNLHESLMQQEVLATLARLAQRIGAALIGEGVETEAEATALAAGGARYGQGHLFAVPAEVRPLRSRRARDD